MSLYQSTVRRTSVTWNIGTTFFCMICLGDAIQACPRDQCLPMLPQVAAGFWGDCRWPSQDADLSTIEVYVFVNSDRGQVAQRQPPGVRRHCDSVRAELLISRSSAAI